MDAKSEMFNSSCKRRFIVTDKMQEEQTGTSAKLSGRPKYQGLFFFTSRETCVNRQRPADQPRTILQTSCSWNVCIQWQCKHLFLQNGSLQCRGQLQTTFWPITNMHVQQTTVYVCKKSTPAEGKRTCGEHSKLESL